MGIRRMLIVTGMLAMTGCSALLATTQENYYHDEVFTPRRSAHDLEVFPQGAPRTPYIVLGRIVATQGMFGSHATVLAELKSRAAEMGADALIDLSDSKGPRPGSDESPSETMRFEQEGNISTSESWVPESKASIRRTLSALAIRYRHP